MSLTDHARATDILADAFKEAGEADMDAGLHDSATVALSIASAYGIAAARMRAAVREEALAYAEAARCTIDHAAMTAPKCPACGHPRG